MDDFSTAVKTRKKLEERSQYGSTRNYTSHRDGLLIFELCTAFARGGYLQSWESRSIPGQWSPFDFETGASPHPHKRTRTSRSDGRPWAIRPSGPAD
jgi:hypothetical protein